MIALSCRPPNIVMCRSLVIIYPVVFVHFLSHENVVNNVSVFVANFFIARSSCCHFYSQFVLFFIFVFVLFYFLACALRWQPAPRVPPTDDRRKSHGGGGGIAGSDSKYGFGGNGVTADANNTYGGIGGSSNPSSRTLHSPPHSTSPYSSTGGVTHNAPLSNSPYSGTPGAPTSSHSSPPNSITYGYGSSQPAQHSSPHGAAAQSPHAGHHPHFSPHGRPPPPPVGVPLSPNNANTNNIPSNTNSSNVNSPNKGHHSGKTVINGNTMASPAATSTPSTNTNSRFPHHHHHHSNNPHNFSPHQPKPPPPNNNNPSYSPTKNPPPLNHASNVPMNNLGPKPTQVPGEPPPKIDRSNKPGKGRDASVAHSEYDTNYINTVRHQQPEQGHVRQVRNSPTSCRWGTAPPHAGKEQPHIMQVRDGPTSCWWGTAPPHAGEEQSHLMQVRNSPTSCRWGTAPPHAGEEQPHLMQVRNSPISCRWGTAPREEHSEQLNTRQREEANCNWLRFAPKQKMLGLLKILRIDPTIWMSQVLCDDFIPMTQPF